MTYVENPESSGNARVPAKGSSAVANLPVHPTTAGPLQPAAMEVSNITVPPSFTADRYEDWKKSMMWWLGLNSGIDETRLLAEIGANALDVANGILQDYFEQTKERKRNRSVLGYIGLVGSRFRRPTEERAMRRIAQWRNMAKKSSESFQEYWAMYDRLKYTLEALGINWHGGIAFAKAFESSRLNNEQQPLVKASPELSTDRRAYRNCVASLRAYLAYILRKLRISVPPKTIRGKKCRLAMKPGKNVNCSQLVRPRQNPKAAL